MPRVVVRSDLSDLLLVFWSVVASDGALALAGDFDVSWAPRWDRARRWVLVGTKVILATTDPAAIFRVELGGRASETFLHYYTPPEEERCWVPAPPEWDGHGRIIPGGDVGGPFEVGGWRYPLGGWSSTGLRFLRMDFLALPLESP